MWVYNSWATDLGSGSAHMRCLDLFKEIYSVGFYNSRATDFGSGIWTNTYPFLKNIIEDPSTYVVWGSTVCGSTILGRWILELDRYIPILQKTYRGPFIMRCSESKHTHTLFRKLIEDPSACAVWGSRVSILGQRILDLDNHIPIL